MSPEWWLTFTGQVAQCGTEYSPGGKTLNDINLLMEISPPPPNLAKNYRMSPAGISYTYLSTDIKTCLMEIKIKNCENAIVGEFITKKSLKILDLSYTPVYEVKSCFSPDYDHSQNWIADFVDHFKNEISTPISEDDGELEYVATQLLAEYIRMKKYDGIKFKSSLNPEGFNYVLFCSFNRNITHFYEESHYGTHLEIIPFTDWLNLICIQYINATTSYKIIDQVKHNDDLAKYHELEKAEELYHEKIQQLWANGKTEFWE